jgi:hypothetical protein
VIHTASIFRVKWPGAELNDFATNSQSVFVSVSLVLSSVSSVWAGRRRRRRRRRKKKKKSLFTADQVGQSVVCLGTEPTTWTEGQMFAFSEFCVMEFVGRHTCRDDGSVFFVLSLRLVHFYFIIILLLLRNNITVFLFLHPIPPL